MTSQKVSSPDAIGVSTVFGGPLVATYLISKNFQAMQQETEAKLAFRIGILVSAVQGIIIVFTPYVESLPNWIGPLTIGLTAYLIAYVYQGDNVKAILESGGQEHSIMNLLGVIILCLLISLIYFVILNVISVLIFA